MTPSNNPGGVLYKCRICGSMESSVHVPDIYIILDHLLNGGTLPTHWIGNVPTLTSFCASSAHPNIIAVSDFCGVQPDNKT
jgi:hypothetical protein